MRFGLIWIMAASSGILKAGVGVGVTGGADKLTLKLMLSRDLN